MNSSRSKDNCGAGTSNARSVSAMSLIVVVSGLCLLAGTEWCHEILTDVDRYLRAVSPLATSPTFARIAGVTVSLATRHRLGWRQGLSLHTAHVAGRGTRRIMRSRAFGPSWVIGQRILHRHRRSQWRITVMIIALATMGSVASAVNRIAGQEAN